MLVSKLALKTLFRLVVINADAPLRVAARAFDLPGAGLAVICDPAGGVAGVLSKSDFVRHLAQHGKPDAAVSELMTRSIDFCVPGDDVYAAWRTMVQRGRQRLPVLDEASRPVGVLDIRDAMQALIEQDSIHDRLFTDYLREVSGR